LWQSDNVPNEAQPGNAIVCVELPGESNYTSIAIEIEVKLEEAKSEERPGEPQ
jgi:hypothetical protein